MVIPNNHAIYIQFSFILKAVYCNVNRYSDDGMILEIIHTFKINFKNI